MIGVFDSGVGGLVSYNELHRLLPSEDKIFLADRANAPYGTKTKDELVRLVKRDIRRLRELGAERILIACCTASTVYGELTEEERAVSIPIILPTAEFLSSMLKDSKKERRVTVIATRHTVNSHSFKNAIESRLCNIEVTEIDAQELVSLAECGNCDGRISEIADVFLSALCERIKATTPSALVLGCTHFSRFRGEFERRLPEIMTVSPAHIGAGEIYKQLKDNTHRCKGIGRCLYTQ